jgi:hypothetical protein
MQGQAQLPTMAVLKFNVTTLSPTPILAARSNASSETSFFLGPGRANVVSFREYHEDILPLVPPHGRACILDQLRHEAHRLSLLGPRQ